MYVHVTLTKIIFFCWRQNWWRNIFKVIFQLSVLLHVTIIFSTLLHSSRSSLHVVILIPTAKLTSTWTTMIILLLLLLIIIIIIWFGQYRPQSIPIRSSCMHYRLPWYVQLFERSSAPLMQASIFRNESTVLCTLNLIISGYPSTES